MEVRIWSPSVKVVGSDSKLVPVYGDGDKVEGTVTLDSKSSPSGRLLVTVRVKFCFNKWHSLNFTRLKDHFIITYQIQMLKAAT